MTRTADVLNTSALKVIKGHCAPFLCQFLGESPKNDAKCAQERQSTVRYDKNVTIPPELLLMRQRYSPHPASSNHLSVQHVAVSSSVAALDWSDAALARTWRTAGMASLGLGVALHACASWIPGTIFLLTGAWAVAKGSPQWRRAAHS